LYSSKGDLQREGAFGAWKYFESMAYTPEIISAKPVGGFFPDEFSILVNEFHPKSLTIDMLARFRVNCVHPNHETGRTEGDLLVRKLWFKDVNNPVWEPRSYRLDKRALADLIVSSEGYPFNLKNAAIGQFGGSQRTAWAGRQKRKDANNCDKSEEPQPGTEHYASLRHCFL
jgi:hypothetical protein